MSTPPQIPEVTELDSDQIADCIDTIVQHYDTVERSTRNYRLRLWKYLDLLWKGSGPYYWDHLTGAWSSITQEDLVSLSQEYDLDPTLANKAINLYRPYGESLVGVLTTGTPRIKYFPDDADKEEDILAARAHVHIEKKVNDDNFMNLKLMQILVKLWNGGFAAVYNYTHTSEEYGTVEEPIKEDRPYNQDTLTCSVCATESVLDPYRVDEEDISEAEEDQAVGTDKAFSEIVDLDNEESLVPIPTPSLDEADPNTVTSYCELCEAETLHTKETDDYGMLPTEVGMNYTPKSKEIIEIYGPLNVKIPSMATKEEDVIWLIKEEEKDVNWAKAHFPEHKDKITKATPSEIDIDRTNRIDLDIHADTLTEQSTIRWVWLKPESYEQLEDEVQIKKLKSLYPNGLKAIYCADIFLEAEAEKLEDHWSISENPLYEFLQSDPLGKALVGLSEVASDLFHLEVETARHAIPETFANPKHLDFEARAQSRAMPGAISPMTPPPSGRLQDNLAETKTATLPKEVSELDIKVEKLFQFISGILPPIFGGPAAGSKTLGEYQESKNQALQRLSITWKILTVLYSKFQSKSVKAYIENLKEDERFVEERGTGNFVNTWIRRQDLEGKVGRVVPELSEQFPATWAQISGRVMELLGMNNAYITSWLLHPENVELITKAIGLDDIYVPEQDQRNKQLYEISQLLISQPIMPQPDPNTGQVPMNPETGEEVGPMPSVPIEPIDNHQVHMAVIQAYMNSPSGIELKQTNEMAYHNVMLHFEFHQAYLQQQMAAQAAEEVEGDEEVEEENSTEEEVQ